MKRTITVIVLAIAALALLVGAALKSRSIPLETHIAQYTLGSEIARLSDDVGTLTGSLETAWRTSQPPGEAANAIYLRIVGSLDRLEQSMSGIPGSAPQASRMRNSFERVEASMATFESLTSTLLTQQNDYAAGVNLLRGSGPEVVRELRAIGLERMAADLFQLMAEAFEYSNPESAGRPAEVRQLLVQLNRDLRIDRDLPDGAPGLLDAVATILGTKNEIQSRLTQLGSSALTENARALAQAASSAYQNAVSSAESARTMLSLYAIVMLLSVAVIGIRLRGSYRELNEANSELGVLNTSLEQRVEERTEDLSNALEELKESQVQLVQAEKMSSLGQLVAGISHEINTPLLYLANNATLIQERIDALHDFVRRSAVALSLNPAKFEDRSEYQHQLIEGLRTLKILLRENELQASAEEIVDLNRDSIEGLKDLTEMAQSLKDFSRLDRAPIDSFDVNSGIEKTLLIARNIVKHKAEVRKFYGELPMIECSPSKINQVFLNLITNAAQAIEDQGEIVITTKVRDEEHIIVTIADTGCGISADILEKICDPFFTTKEVGAGTGLGLSIVDEIVRSHGGELLIESTPGTGSTFSVVLPIRHPEGIDDDELVADAVEAEAATELPAADELAEAV